MMNFMGNKKKHGAVKVIICIAAAVVIGAGGFYAGVRSQTDSMINALPRAAVETAPAEGGGVLPTERTAAEEPVKAQATEATVFVGKSNVSAASEGTWSTVDSCNYDISGDGVNDTVTLYTSAESDDMGILWDDTQQWILEVSDGGNGYYTLLDTSVSNGSVYYQVNELNDGTRTIVVYITTGAGTEISEYIFGKAGFTEKEVYSSSGINTVHSSIPWYK